MKRQADVAGEAPEGAAADVATPARLAGTADLTLDGPAGGAGAGRDAAPWRDEDLPPSGRRSLVRLLVVLAGIVALGAVFHALAVLLVIALLALMIMLHEFGHFATAKLSGMKVTEYFLGFGPRVWSFRKGETEYGVKVLPAGGYVRIVGMTTAEEVEPPDEQRTYRHATFPRRLAVGVAGSTMHFVMAFLLLLGLYAVVGSPVATGASVGPLYDFSHGSTPAQLAGLEQGDTFVAVDGHTVTDPDWLLTFIEDHAGSQLLVVVRRDGHLVTLHLTPVDGRTVSVKGSTSTVKPASGPSQGVIGIQLDEIAHDQRGGVFGSFAQAGGMLGSLTKATVQEIGQVFSPSGLAAIAHDLAQSTSSNASSASSAQADNRPVSIVGVVQVASQAASQDVGELLLILAAVNIFVGLFNMFPMLPLDGGHVAIAVYERIRSRRGRRYYADVQKMMPFAYAVLAFIVLFGMSALYLDIVSPIHLPGG